MIKKWVITGAMAFGLLVSAPVSGFAAMGDHTLRPGTWDNDVYELQGKLKAMGYFDFAVTTGYYGPVTKDAVIKYQKAKGLLVDGIAGQQTFNSIQNNSFEINSITSVKHFFFISNFTTYKIHNF